jgi:hypothetical protein
VPIKSRKQEYTMLKLSIVWNYLKIFLVEKYSHRTLYS